MLNPDELATLPLFREMSRAAIAALAVLGVELSLPTDGVVFITGSMPRGWYVVLEGQVRVVRVSGNRQHVVHTEAKGGTLGEVPVFAAGTHPATGIASEPTRLALWSREVLERVIEEHPAVALLLVRRLASRVRGLVERLDERSIQSVGERLLDFMLERQALRPHGSFNLGMTQQQLAEELGTAREVVSRELKRLKKDGIVESVGSGRFRFSS